ncbi:MAG: TonB-dependent receptor [Opitutaceae bacterium]
MRRSLGLALVTACALSGRAQTALSSDLIQAPAMIVNEGALISDAAGVTPVSIDPVSSDGLDTWSALDRSVANFHVAEGGAAGFGSLFTLRGLANTPYFSEPAVTMYYADIPLASSFAYPSLLDGFAEAAVHDGPQGTEFGRATDGGVVVFTPEADGTAGGGRLAAGFGSYSERDGAVMTGSRPGGMVSAQADAGYQARLGYIFNTLLGRPVDDQERENAFAQIRIAPSTYAAFTVEAFATRERDGAQPLVPLGGPLFVVSRPQEGVTDLDSWGAAVKGAFTLPFATVSMVTSVTDWRMNPYTDYLVLPPPLSSLVLQDQKAWNEEIRMVVLDQGPIAIRGGIWLSKETTTNAVARSIAGVVPIEDSGFDQDSESAAAYADAVFDPAPDWQITAGTRIETDGKTFDRSETVPVAGLLYHGEGRYDAFLPRVAARWSAGANQHIEAAGAWGMRPGGFSSYTDNTAFIPFAAERVAAYTLGWDWAARDRAVEFAVRGFYDRIGDYQIERSFTATDYFVATAARAHSSGAEADASWHPAKSWTARITAGWTDARLDRYNAPVGGEDLSGNRAPDIPRFTSDLSLAYHPAAGWFAAADLAAVGRTDYDEMGTPADIQGGYATLAARTGYTAARWTATVYGENLTDKGYYTLIVPGVNSAAPGAPRVFGAEFEVRF